MNVSIELYSSKHTTLVPFLIGINVASVSISMLWLFIAFMLMVSMFQIQKTSRSPTDEVKSDGAGVEASNERLPMNEETVGPLQSVITIGLGKKDINNVQELRLLVPRLMNMLHITSNLFIALCFLHFVLNICFIYRIMAKNIILHREITAKSPQSRDYRFFISQLLLLILAIVLTIVPAVLSIIMNLTLNHDMRYSIWTLTKRVISFLLMESFFIVLMCVDYTFPYVFRFILWDAHLIELLKYVFSDLIMIYCIRMISIPRRVLKHMVPNCHIKLKVDREIVERVEKKRNW